MGGRQSKVDSNSSVGRDGSTAKTIWADEEEKFTYTIKEIGESGEKEPKMTNKMYQKSKEEWFKKMNKTSEVLKDLKDVILSLEHKAQQEIIIKSNPCEKEECIVVKCYEAERAGDKLKCKAAVDAYYECSKKAYQ